jgi:hypothetical protein
VTTNILQVTVPISDTLNNTSNEITYINLNGDKNFTGRYDLSKQLNDRQISLLSRVQKLHIGLYKLQDESIGYQCRIREAVLGRHNLAVTIDVFDLLHRNDFIRAIPNARATNRRKELDIPFI